jgi:hypothetical protein
MRGTRTVEPDGRISYVIWICDKQKQELISKWIVACMSHDTLKRENLS